jgi:hypothetical protein
MVLLFPFFREHLPEQVFAEPQELEEENEVEMEMEEEVIELSGNKRSMQVKSKKKS